MACMTLPWAPVATRISSLPLAGSGPSQRLQDRCSARPGCGIMGAQARASPGGAGRPLRRRADCKGDLSRHPVKPSGPAALGEWLMIHRAEMSWDERY